MPAPDLPAILGGTPIRASAPEWPPRAAWVSDTFESLAASGDWGVYHGPNCPALGNSLQELHRVPHVQLTCSGSMAVELALRILRLPAGSEVILSAYDYKPNFTTILHLGLRPVLVDIDPRSAQMDVQQLDAACSDHTKAILTSHLQGSLVDMVAVRQFADNRGLSVIEDASQMLGGTIQGKLAGTWGDVGVLSFGGSKLITTGRGGAVLTSREDLAQRLKLETQRGNDIYPLSELQAAMLLPQLEQLAARRELRQKCVAAIELLLASYRGLQPFQQQFAQSQPDYYKLGFWYDPNTWDGLSRTGICAAMRAEGIPFDIGFQGLHLTHARSRFRSVGDLPHATHADQSVVAVHHPFLTEPHATAELQAALDRVQGHALAIAQQLTKSQ